MKQISDILSSQLDYINLELSGEALAGNNNVKVISI